MDKNPKVFVVVLNYNGRDCILKDITSLLCSDYSNFEVVLADNGSTDGSFEFIKRYFPKIACIRNDNNLGNAAGNNIGIEYALERGAQYVWLLRNGMKVEKQTLSALVRFAQSDGKIGLANPLILKGDAEEFWFSGGKISWWRMKIFHLKSSLKKDYLGSDYLAGCVLLVKAEVFKKIGFLDEKYFFCFEDADFSVRAKSAGFKLGVSSLSRIRYYEKSAKNPESKIYWRVISGLAFFKKHTPPYLRPWMYFYLMAKIARNKFDLAFRKNNLAKTTAKAYKDFNYAE